MHWVHHDPPTFVQIYIRWVSCSRGWVAFLTSVCSEKTSSLDKELYICSGTIFHFSYWSYIQFLRLYVVPWKQKCLLMKLFHWAELQLIHACMHTRRSTLLQKTLQNKFRIVLVGCNEHVNMFHCHGFCAPRRAHSKEQTKLMDLEAALKWSERFSEMMNNFTLIFLLSFTMIATLYGQTSLVRSCNSADAMTEVEQNKEFETSICLNCLH